MATIIKSNEDVKDQILQLETQLSGDIQAVDTSVQAVSSAVSSAETNIVSSITNLDSNISGDLGNIQSELVSQTTELQQIETELQTANTTLTNILSAVGGGAAGTSVETTVTAATTSTLLLASEPTRSELYIRNNSSKDMWVHFGAGPAVVGKGILLSRQDALTDDIYTGAVYAIWDTGVTGSAEIIEVTP